ncbi:hypothetical protein [Vibrio maritimus]|uniref:hypothetical protein n=1 Tax=Vibrio maritimus TaxID=990268 RepID=UPI001F1E4789|nr:hypothetical protein [Vibrio maritimus]
MKDIATRLQNNKNQWLASQVEGGYPTKESLKGRDLYLEAQSSCHLEPLEAGHESAFDIEWHLVDFHRLTIMFSILQSKRWANEKHQQLIVEFLTQIIVEPAHSLYLGFLKGNPIAAAMLCQEGETTLISDITCDNETCLIDSDSLAASLIQSVGIATNSQIWLEKR